MISFSSSSDLVWGFCNCCALFEWVHISSQAYRLMTSKSKRHYNMIRFLYARLLFPKSRKIKTPPASLTKTGGAADKKTNSTWELAICPVSIFAREDTARCSDQKDFPGQVQIFNGSCRSPDSRSGRNTFRVRILPSHRGLPAMAGFRPNGRCRFRYVLTLTVPVASGTLTPFSFIAPWPRGRCRMRFHDPICALFSFGLPLHLSTQGNGWLPYSFRKGCCTLQKEKQLPAEIIN